MKNPNKRDKPDGFDCLDGDGVGDGEERDSDGLLDVLVAGVGLALARIGVEHRWFGNGGDSGGTPDNESLRNEPP